MSECAIVRERTYVEKLLQIFAEHPGAAGVFLENEEAIRLHPHSMGSDDEHQIRPVTLPGAEVAFKILYVVDGEIVRLKEIKDAPVGREAGFFDREFDD